MPGVLDQLEAIREQSGKVRTTGLDNDTVCQFVSRDPDLVEAVNAATQEFEVLHRYYPGPEASYRYALLCKKLGNAELAAEIFTGIVGNAKNASKQYSAIHRRWLRLAESELKN